MKYIQVRRICTDTREDFLAPDVEVYERVFENVKSTHDVIGHFYSAEVFKMFGKEVCFWRTVKTTIDSFNYYSDGTMTDEYFVIESSNPAVQGLAGCTAGFVDFLYEMAVVA